MCCSRLSSHCVRLQNPRCHGFRFPEDSLQSSNIGGSIVSLNPLFVTRVKMEEAVSDERPGTCALRRGRLSTNPKHDVCRCSLRPTTSLARRNVWNLEPLRCGIEGNMASPASPVQKLIDCRCQRAALDNFTMEEKYIVATGLSYG